MIKKDLAPREFKGPTKRIRKGLLLVYTGEGKGKSTAGFGAVFRSLGRGFKVAVVQFIKGKWVSGEVKALEKFGPKVNYFSVGEDFTWNTKNLDRDVATARRGWEKCLELLRANKHDVYLFDELVYVLKYEFLPLNEVLAGLKERSPQSHVIVTGRDAAPELIAMADLVTEMKEIKHPFQKGILAQPGIDY
jgi:cob(I)alamin adenosyltransferase